MKTKLMQLLAANAETQRKPLQLVRNEGSNDVTLYLYDVIDAYWGINAETVARLVGGLTADDTLHLRINSPGGDVFEARAMAAAIRGCPAGKVIAHVDGLAASAATTVAIAAGEVEMDPQAFFMIHNAWSICIGDKSDMDDMSGLLDKIDASIVADYAACTGKPADEIAAWMEAETWFTAQEAVDAGFADRISEGSGKADNTSARRWNLGAFERAPAALIETPAAEPDWAAVHAHNVRRLRLFEIA